MEQQENRSIGGWIKESKNGNSYISFKLPDDAKPGYYAIFRNTKKVEGSNQPDYNILPPKDEMEDGIKMSDINF